MKIPAVVAMKQELACCEVQADLRTPCILSSQPNHGSNKRSLESEGREAAEPVRRLSKTHLELPVLVSNEVLSHAYDIIVVFFWLAGLQTLQRFL